MEQHIETLKTERPSILGPKQHIVQGSIRKVGSTDGARGWRLGSRFEGSGFRAEGLGTLNPKGSSR